jgi:hypothetical protein
VPFLFAILFVVLFLPVPSLVVGWIQFIRAKNRFDAPRWRWIVGLSSLILATLIGLSLLTIDVLVPNGSDLLQTLGICFSALCLAMSLAGKRPLRVPVSLASVGLICLWLVWHLDI